LSEQLGWFGFHEDKGSPLAIALAAVIVSMLLMFIWIVVRLGFRRRFQYSLRSLLVLVLLVSIVMSWVATKRQWATSQRQAAAEIEKLGGAVRWDMGCVREGGFLSEATNVSFEGTQVTDAALEHLNGLTHLLWLEFQGTNIRDSGLRYLKGLARLRWLNLEATQVTDAGLEHLESLGQLQGLSLCGTQITGTGLHHLKGLRQLDSLYLGNTRVTDVELEQLKGFRQLRWLDLRNTHATDNSVKRLQQALPDCQIWR
jgi:hypothetical protein